MNLALHSTDTKINLMDKIDLKKTSINNPNKTMMNSALHEKDEDKKVSPESQVILITNEDEADSIKATGKEITRFISKKCKKKLRKKFNITGRKRTKYYAKYLDGKPCQNKEVEYIDSGVFVNPSWEGAERIEYMGTTQYVTHHPYGKVYIINKSKFQH